MKKTAQMTGTVRLNADRLQSNGVDLFAVIKRLYGSVVDVTEDELASIYVEIKLLATTKAMFEVIEFV